MSSKPIRLLLVEDNPDDSELIVALLEEIEGFSVKADVASRMHTALELLAGQPYDVMLLDLSLPDSHGLASIDKVRMRNPNLPIVIMTGLNDHAVALEAARAGAQDYLVKGKVDPDSLGRSLRYAIERARAETELRAHRDHLEDLVEKRTSDLRKNSDFLRHEIEQRRQAEESLRLLAAAVESAGEGILITNTNGAIEYVNPATERMTGYKKEELIGKNPRIFNSGQQDDEFFQNMYQQIASGRVWHGQFTNKNKNGKLFNCDTTISALLDNLGNPLNYIAIHHDVTEEFELRERLNRAQRLESIGQLAGGVAHDFNNILQAILGYARLSLDEIVPGTDLYHHNEEIVKAANRAAELTKQLLAFSRRQLLKREPADLNAVVRNVLNMLRRLMREDIDLDLVPGHELGTIEGDIGQLEQVLVNLCVNARDAMPKGGRITIETENVMLNGQYTKTHPWARAGRFILLSVTDSGLGMPPEVVDRAFEPFYTTKEGGNGTGLGLATCYGIVKQHDGFIHCYSEVGKGTTFKIYLPISSRRAESVGPKIVGPATGGTETILIVEDDTAIRTLVARILKKAGYTVLTANDGEDALTTASNGDKLDLIISDVVMPKMGGLELYSRLQEQGSKVPVLLASGYSSRAILPDDFSHDGAALIQKPYDPDDLLRKVRALLDPPTT